MILMIKETAPITPSIIILSLMNSIKHNPKHCIYNLHIYECIYQSQ